jgi:hypothetical protein
LSAVGWVNDDCGNLHAFFLDERFFVAGVKRFDFAVFRRLDFSP